MWYGQAIPVAAVGDAIAYVVLALVVLFGLGVIALVVKRICDAKRRGEPGPIKDSYSKGHKLGWDVGQKLAEKLRGKPRKDPPQER